MKSYRRYCRFCDRWVSTIKPVKVVGNLFVTCEEIPRPCLAKRDKKGYTCKTCFEKRSNA